MDNVLQALLSWQFITFCLAVSAITETIRRIAEYFLDFPSVPMSKQSKLWQMLILPTAPIFTGVLLALCAKNYPYPDGISAESYRIYFGLAAGLLSGTVYGMIKGLIKSKLPMINLPTINQGQNDSSADNNVTVDPVVNNEKTSDK